MYGFTTRMLDFVYITMGRVKFAYFFRISPVKLKFSMFTTLLVSPIWRSLWYVPSYRHLTTSIALFLVS